ncbi:MAG TPA: hypothetical protein VH251_09150, partial [Verrucomicrobiae bacterium]|nr:hypothetical protein [Verrucomicrobiae bacterium]
MKHGGYGKPWRPPADGWSVPPKIFFGGLYQHVRPALNNLPRYQNNTQVTLQPNEVGSPTTRINPAALVANCGVTDSSGLPEIPWIGVGAGQSLPPVLGGTLQNTFALNGTNNLGRAARLRGFKNVQALRQWHGCLPWTSHDGVSGGCPDTICLTAMNDILGNTPTTPGWEPTYTSRAYEAPRLTPTALKYLTLSVSALYNYSDNNAGGATGETVQRNSTCGGSRSVDPSSGKITSNLLTTEDQYDSVGFWNNPADHSAGYTWKLYQTRHVRGGLGWTYDPTKTPYSFGNIYDPPLLAALPQKILPSGTGSALDGVANTDYHCATAGIPGVTDLLDIVNSWNSLADSVATAEGNYLKQPRLAPISNLNSYAGDTGSYTDESNNTARLQISWTRSDTVFTWNYSFTQTQTYGGGFLYQHSETFSGTATLSNPNPAAAVYADVQNLLGYWNLADDAQYPPRTDGLWQMAPLVSREESGGDVSPIGFNFAYVNDLRQPIVDSNGNNPFTWPVTPLPLGWTYDPNNNDANELPPSDPSYAGPAPWNPTYNQMAWFDTNAYAFSFPPGRDQGSSAANGWGQFALTGLICGMPMPRAFTDSASFWYSPSSSFPSSSTFENFFDFRASVWHACAFEGGVDIYAYGYGQWLYDAIGTTGAQLPHCATQWTNNLQAATKPPYAYLIQSDQQTYDEDGQDFTGSQQDALWAQKCCEILELWPSQDFARPAGNDRFAPDELAVYCIGSVSGNVITLNSSPTGIANSDYVGMASNGFSGIYAVAAVSTLANTVTLVNGPVYPLPTGFALPSNDTGTCLWRVRFKSAPPIQGRDAIANLAASGGNTIITLGSPEVNLMTGDTIDICSTTITYDARGNRVSEQMTVLQTVAVNRTDETHFIVGVAIGTLAGAAYIVSHGAPAWYWDDNGRKGDFAAFQWLYDYRTNGEASRLSAVTDCSGHTPPSGTTAANTGYQAPGGLGAVCSPGNSLNWTGDSFQAQGASVFKPCCYGVVAITPN